MNYLQNPIRIAIADDHEIFRNGFKLLLKDQPEMQLLGDAENGIELLKLCKTEFLDIVFVDIQMPKMNGIEFCKQLRLSKLKTKIIALSMFNDDDLIVSMLGAGASGYLLKNTNRQELLRAAVAVHEGGSYYCNSIEKKLTYLISNNRYHPHRKNSAIDLTEREIEVLILICKQFSNKEIANKLRIGIRTVESYREILNNKTYAKNSAGLVVYAVKNRLYDPHEFE
jgi:two-component system response regulator NreC